MRLPILAALCVLASPALAQRDMSGSRQACIQNGGGFVAGAQVQVWLMNPGRTAFTTLLMQFDTPVLTLGQRHCFTVQRDAFVQVRFRHHDGIRWIEQSCQSNFNGYDAGASIWGTTLAPVCGGLR